MYPRVLMFLSNTEGMDDFDKQTNHALIRLYLKGVVEAKWEGNEPVFSMVVSEEESNLLMYARS